MDLRLRPLRFEDEAAYRAAYAELLVDGFSFGSIKDAASFAEHLQRLERQRRGRDLGDLVEATWLAAEVRGEIDRDPQTERGHRPVVRRRANLADV